MADIERLGGLDTVEGRCSGRYKRTDRRFDAQFCHVWAMRGEVLTDSQQYTDTAQWHEAMGVDD